MHRDTHPPWVTDRSLFSFFIQSPIVDAEAHGSIFFPYQHNVGCPLTPRWLDKVFLHHLFKLFINNCTISERLSPEWLSYRCRVSGINTVFANCRLAQVSFV